MASKFLYVYVFLTGATVMSIEMSASRLIAPYFGTSLIVWSNIIGIILLAMSLGYVFGGRIADRYPRPGVLFGISLGAGLILSVIPLAAQGVFQFLTAGILATPVRISLLVFVGTLFVFAPPVFMLAMVSPFALRLSVQSTGQAGETAGRLNAFSTLGSLLGTFIPSLILIPSIGTRATIFWSSFILIGISAVGLKRWWAAALALIPLALLVLAPTAVKASGKVLWEKETPYQYAQVVEQKDGSIALVYNEGGGYQSVYRPDHVLPPQDYYNYYLLLPFLRPAEEPDVWILGSAGGTMLGLFDRWVHPPFPGLRLTGVEIDPDIIPLGTKFFGLKGNEGEVINSDARIFLTSKKEKADLIIVDAYSQQIYIPFHLATQEFYREVKAHLEPEGILALNVNAISPTSELLQSFEQTLNSVFAYTYVLPVPGSYNYVLLASESPLSIPEIPADLPMALQPSALHYTRELSAVQPSGGMIFTDDKAPVEFLTDQMIWQTLFGNAQPGEKPALSEKASAPTDAPVVKPEALALYDEGHRLYDQQQFTQAILKFDQALKIDPACFQALTLKGASLAFQGKYDQGLDLIQQALSLNRSYVYGYFNLGLANELAGRWQDSIAAYTHALELDNRDTWSYYGIASIYGRQGKAEQVIEYLKPAIALNPGVKDVARTEHDFAPVRSDSRFQELVKP
ncbi:fused MFS/spermidine synthase [Paradesulfitobacterium ferrireducens]|uniref:fused MFS/spermidine synthase n=1 Tax=Paradesulfitobacterium ferrireducens TaxID=2816476 RepID=UPI001F22CE15|nr:fused MFS/spermidine synthase [Paradesulfitobacterium ferrireducens]